jgi:hypothetical protein
MPATAASPATELFNSNYSMPGSHLAAIALVRKAAQCAKLRAAAIAIPE